jgi:hypothetical protein
VEYLRLEHPAERLIPCNRSQCDYIADSLETNVQRGDNFPCAFHTSSRRNASVLPKGVPTSGR